MISISLHYNYHNYHGGQQSSSWWTIMMMMMMNNDGDEEEEEEEEEKDKSVEDYSGDGPEIHLKFWMPLFNTANQPSFYTSATRL